MSKGTAEVVETLEQLGDELVIRTFGGHVTLDAAALLFGVRRETLQTAAWRGSLPARKLTENGGQGLWMVRPGDVARYLAKGPGRPPTRRRSHRSTPESAA